MASKLAKLNDDERFVVAALLASMAAARGKSENAEFAMLKRVAADLDFDLFAAMAVARKSFASRKDLLAAARAIEGEDIRAEVRLLLDEVAMADGNRSSAEAALLSQIDALWSPTAKAATPKSGSVQQVPLAPDLRREQENLERERREFEARKAADEKKKAAEEARRQIEAQRQQLEDAKRQYEEQERQRKEEEKKRQIAQREAIKPGRYQVIYGDAQAAMQWFASMNFANAEIKQAWLDLSSNGRFSHVISVTTAGLLGADLKMEGNWRYDTERRRLSLSGTMSAALDMAALGGLAGGMNPFGGAFNPFGGAGNPFLAAGAFGGGQPISAPYAWSVNITRVFGSRWEGRDDEGRGVVLVK